MLRRFIPLIGILFYVLLYIYSASLYPGGSQADRTSIGYVWYLNFWCDLFGEKALNGETNPARSFAIIANCILALTMTFFFYCFPLKYNPGKYWNKITPCAGLVSMIFAGLLFTGYHDNVSILSGFFGVIALTGVFIGLIKARLFTLIIFGLGCFVLILVNNVIYFSGFGLHYLPVIQKITLVYIFGWVLGVYDRASRVS